jgi:large subunit ribosomal protein L29
MDAEKIRNLTGPELLHQQTELNDQLFRLKFQLKMGQTESLKKIRGLRKDVARIQTIMREQELGIGGKKAAAPDTKATKAAKAPEAAAKPEKSAAAKPAKAKASKATAAKKPAKASAGTKKRKK